MLIACTFVDDVTCVNEMLLMSLSSYFINEGGVSESGTHDQLLALRGDYYEYVQFQALSKK